MPIIVRFNAKVRDRAAIEQALVVTSSKPAEGAWSWVSDEEVHYRPKAFWPAYSNVKLDVDMQERARGWRRLGHGRTAP